MDWPDTIVPDLGRLDIRECRRSFVQCPAPHDCSDSSHMRLLIVSLVIVLLIIIDQAWYRGAYLVATGRMIRQLFTSIGL